MNGDECVDERVRAGTWPLFRHFKGHVYEIVSYALDSEVPSRELVVYRLRLTKEAHGRELIVSDAELRTPEWLAASGVPSPRDRTWVRHVAMFFEHVERDGYSGPRFRPVRLKPIDVCCCGHTEKEHWHDYADDYKPTRCHAGSGECKCDAFDAEQEVVEAV